MPITSAITLQKVKISPITENHYVTLQILIFVNLMSNLRQLGLIQLYSDRNSEGISGENFGHGGIQITHEVLILQRGSADAHTFRHSSGTLRH